MAYFDASKNWVILLPNDKTHIEKAAGDLARYIGLLVSLDGTQTPKPLPMLDASGSAPDETIPIIILNYEDRDFAHNGFSWRAGPDRVEILGDSGRGLCNGIYSFLGALGLSWPSPNEEKLPPPSVKSPEGFPLAANKAHVSSQALQRYVEKKTPSGELITWAARQRYDTIVFNLSASSSRKLKSLKEYAQAYIINLEAGVELSALLPRRHFLLNSDFFRMEDGKRVKQHYFCPTSPGAISLAAKEAKKLFQAADVNVYHLWLDRESAWCSCPSCRAFTKAEQIRIAVNIAADALSAVKLDAHILYFEKPGEGEKIPLRKNVLRMEELAD